MGPKSITGEGRMRRHEGYFGLTFTQAIKFEPQALTQMRLYIGLQSNTNKTGSRIWLSHNFKHMSLFLSTMPVTHH